MAPNMSKFFDYCDIPLHNHSHRLACCNCATIDEAKCRTSWTRGDVSCLSSGLGKYLQSLKEKCNKIEKRRNVCLRVWSFPRIRWWTVSSMYTHKHTADRRKCKDLHPEEIFSLAWHNEKKIKYRNAWALGAFSVFLFTCKNRDKHSRKGE